MNPITRFVVWLLTRLFERSDIGRDAGNDLYLVRWTLLGKRFGPGGKVFLHWFHRSDYDTLHDHPWPFWSLILWGGYFEETFYGHTDPETGEKKLLKKWYGPGRLLKRPAEWAHRVELPPGRRSWSLVWTGPKVRSWGFHCPGGWIPWRRHAANLGRTGSGCGEG